MEEYGSLPNLFCTGESEAGTIMRKSGELRHKLRGVYYGIADNWLRIIENKVLRDEVAKHLAGYRIFCCIKDGRRLKRLKISSDIGRKGDDSYPVMAILKDYPYNPD